MAAVKDTILLRDIIFRYSIKDARLLEDIFAYLVNTVSNLTSVSNLVNYFGSKNRRVNYETISHYIHYLETAFLVHRSVRYQIKGKRFFQVPVNFTSMTFHSGITFIRDMVMIWDFCWKTRFICN